jgi:predicted DNA-binding mobile mystery protein A
MNKKLAIEQMDIKFNQIKESVPFSVALKGKWISSLRELLGMSMRQLGERIDVNPQSQHQFEKSELNGSISLKNLEKIAEAMNMNMYYGMYPKGGSVEKLIDQQATKRAREIVERSSQTMTLEDQKNSRARLDNAIKNRSEEIMRNMPRNLWD